MVPIENKNNAYAKFGGQIKSIILDAPFQARTLPLFLELG